MYYREQEKAGERGTLPEHYSGCAFSPNLSQPEPILGIDVAKPSAPIETSFPQKEKKRLSIQLPDSDELLLFGLMLLLSDGESHNELTSLLSLLLFCG